MGPVPSPRPAGSRAGRSVEDDVNRDDDRYWVAGLFYVNREDRAVLVPKRHGGLFGSGLGRTLNFAHPVSWFLLAVPIVVAVIAGSAGPALTPPPVRGSAARRAGGPARLDQQAL